MLILQIPRRRRSCILETLKEYEDLEHESPTVTPGIILFFCNHECKCSLNFHDFFLSNGRKSLFKRGNEYPVVETNCTEIVQKQSKR